MGTISLRLMSWQLKYIVSHTKIYIRCILFSVWVQHFVLNCKGALWNFTQNFENIHDKIYISRGVIIWQITISYSYISQVLTYWGRDKMAAIFQTTLSNAFSWMTMLKFWLRFHWSLSQGSNYQYSSIGSDNGLAPARRQAIIWTNDG